QERRLDPPWGRRYIAHRSERLEGQEERPNEAPEPTERWRHRADGDGATGEPAGQRGREVTQPGWIPGAEEGRKTRSGNPTGRSRDRPVGGPPPEGAGRPRGPHANHGSPGGCKTDRRTA